MLRLKQNGGFYIGDFFIETPIANINSSPINHLVRYLVCEREREGGGRESKKLIRTCMHSLLIYCTHPNHLTINLFLIFAVMGIINFNNFYN